MAEAYSLVSRRWEQNYFLTPGAPNENIVQNHLNTELFNVF